MKQNPAKVFLGIENISGWSGKVFLYQELPSTSTHMLAALKSNFQLERDFSDVPILQEHDIVWTYHQTVGRGRQGKIWVAPSGSEAEENQVLTFSVLIKLDKNNPALYACKKNQTAKKSLTGNNKSELSSQLLKQGSTFSHVVAWCWNEVFARHGINTMLKWPNDILFSGKKLVGILTESVNISGSIYLVVGMGVNLYLSKEFLTKINKPATALNECLEAVNGKPVSINDIDPRKWLQEFLAVLHMVLPIWKNDGFAPLVGSWKTKSDLIGKTVEFYNVNSELPDELKTGIVEDVDEESMVLIREKLNEKTVLNSEENFSKFKTVTKVSLGDILII